MKKINNKKFLYKITIIITGFLLLCLWVVSVLFIVSDDKFFTLSYNKTLTKNDNYRATDNKIKGNFIAPNNNLGIITVKFNINELLKLSNNDEIKFTLVGKDGNEHASNSYYINSLETSPNFPFGFLPIAESKDKLFTFTLESVSGQNLENLILTNEGNNLSTKYVFNRSDVISNPNNAINFAIYKIYASFKNQDILRASIPYLFPFIFFIVVLLLNSLAKQGKLNFVREIKLSNHKYVHILVLFVVFNLYFNLAGFFELVYLIFIPIWIYVLGKYKLSSSITFFYAFIIFLISILALTFNAEELIQSLSTWTFMFLISGTIQLIWEINRKNKKIEVVDYLKKIIGK